MKYISFGGAYINVDHIESIRTINSSTARECIVVTVSGYSFKEVSSNDLSRAVLDKILDDGSGYKSK